MANFWGITPIRNLEEKLKTNLTDFASLKIHYVVFAICPKVKEPTIDI